MICRDSYQQVGKYGGLGGLAANIHAPYQSTTECARTRSQRCVFTFAGIRTNSIDRVSATERCLENATSYFSRITSASLQIIYPRGRIYYGKVEKGRVLSVVEVDDIMSKVSALLYLYLPTMQVPTYVRFDTPWFQVCRQLRISWPRTVRGFVSEMLQEIFKN